MDIPAYIKNFLIIYDAHYIRNLIRLRNRQQRIIRINNNFSSIMRPNRNIKKINRWKKIFQNDINITAQSRSGSTSKRINKNNGIQIIQAFTKLINNVYNIVFYWRSMIEESICPIISATFLLVDYRILNVIPAFIARD